MRFHDGHINRLHVSAAGFYDRVFRGVNCCLVGLCFSLPGVTTDMVVSVSVPLQISASSSSSSSFQFNNAAEIGAELFQQVLRSVVVHDWTLFG